VLLLIDDREGIGVPERALIEQLGTARLTLVRNKIDLTARTPGVYDGVLGPEVALSALTGAGLDGLRAHLKASVGYVGAGEGGFLARRRHLDALRRAGEALARGAAALAEQRAGELAAEELRLAQQALGEITGEVTPDDLLGRIFAAFCIGK
jgi:tRNA modification GTPase